MYQSNIPYLKSFQTYPELTFSPVTQSAYDINSPEEFSSAFKKTISNIPAGKYVEIEIIFNENITRERGLILAANLPFITTIELGFTSEDYEEYLHKIKHIIESTEKFTECKFYHGEKTASSPAKIDASIKRVDFIENSTLIVYYDCKYANISSEQLKSDYLEVFDNDFSTCTIS